MPAKPSVKVVRLKKPACWIYEHEDGDVIVYGRKRIPRELTVEKVNFLLDCAKRRLLQ